MVVGVSLWGIVMKTIGWVMEPARGIDFDLDCQLGVISWTVVSFELDVG